MQENQDRDISSAVGRLIRGGGILVDRLPVAVFPEAGQVEEVLWPLLGKALGSEPGGARGLVGIAGPPGCGKSVLAGWLAATAQAMRIPGVAFLSLDGYHLPNAELARRTGMGREGRRVPLLGLKGTPETFDAARLLADLQRLKSSAAAMSLPGYSREVHEPVPGAVNVSAGVRWVFVEGNFLFLDEPVWRDVCGLLDYRIFVEASDAVLRASLAARHGRAGRTAGWIEGHFAAVDGPNIERVRASSAAADVVLWRGENGVLEIREWGFRRRL